MVQKKDQKAAKRLNFGVAADSSLSEEEDDRNSPIVDVQPHIDMWHVERGAPSGGTTSAN